MFSINCNQLALVAPIGHVKQTTITKTVLMGIAVDIIESILRTVITVQLHLCKNFPVQWTGQKAGGVVGGTGGAFENVVDRRNVTHPFHLTQKGMPHPKTRLKIT